MLPKFAIDEGKHGTNLCFSVSDEAEIQALRAFDDAMVADVCQKKAQYFGPDFKKSDDYIGDNFRGKLSAVKQDSKGNTYHPTYKSSLDAKALAEGTLRIVDEDDIPVTDYSTLAGRRWLKVLVAAKSVYGQGGGVSGISRRLIFAKVSNDRSIGGVPLGPIRNASSFNMKTDCVLSTTLTDLGVGRKIGEISDAANGGKLQLLLTGGGSLPPFTFNKSELGGFNITLGVAAEEEVVSMENFNEDVISHIVDNRKTLLPTLASSDQSLKESVYSLISKKKEGERAFEQLLKLSLKAPKKIAKEGAAADDVQEDISMDDFESNATIVDEEGNVLRVQDIAGRRWKTCLFLVRCLYRSGKNMGVSRELVKLVVDSAETDNDLIPL